jgi:limonene-1,2-epoxide hydrolase
LAAVVLVLTACGGHAARSPEAVARAWSAALDRNDNRGAAALFKSGAEVVQDTPLVLQGRNDAVRWNRLLPCGGFIQSVEPQGDNEVLVVFTLTERPGHTCDGPGQYAAAVFKVEHGKIVLWHQVPPPGPAI